jgi:xanthine dehydrogenase accessory factor
MTKSFCDLKILIRGAGEMASGVAHVLRTSGFRLSMTEIPRPMAIRRHVSFCESVWDGYCVVEGVRAQRVNSWEELDEVIETGAIPVLVDPEFTSVNFWKPDVIIDATLAKRNLGLRSDMAELVVALGPGFEAPEDADVIVETNRGHDLGRLISKGEAAPNTGVPETVAGYSTERVVHSPLDGTLKAKKHIGDLVKKGETIALIDNAQVVSTLTGVLRGMIRDSFAVKKGLKIADIDPRGETMNCWNISDKARALGGSVLWAIVSTFNPNPALEDDQRG